MDNIALGENFFSHLVNGYMQLRVEDGEVTDEAVTRLDNDHSVAASRHNNNYRAAGEQLAQSIETQVREEHDKSIRREVDHRLRGRRKQLEQAHFRISTALDELNSESALKPRLEAVRNRLEDAMDGMDAINPRVKPVENKEGQQLGEKPGLQVVGGVAA